VFVQITRTTPLRRTILQFSQIRLTLARTFMTAPQLPQLLRLVVLIAHLLRRGANPYL